LDGDCWSGDLENLAHRKLESLSILLEFLFTMVGVACIPTLLERSDGDIDRLILFFPASADLGTGVHKRCDGVGNVVEHTV